ncbi:uncharacterized protein VTP21DRAFT_6692 [Calcarisporiella thermophila]|uniref:uncharacterized protein n=1 Tax=Calcarisporiella thermophila TaxID=911321 RepID=UPI003742D7A0
MVVSCSHGAIALCSPVLWLLSKQSSNDSQWHHCNLRPPCNATIPDDCYQGRFPQAPKQHSPMIRQGLARAHPLPPSRVAASLGHARRYGAAG